MNKKKIDKRVIILIFSCIGIFLGICVFANAAWDSMKYENERRLKPSGKVYKKYEKLDKKHLYIVTKDDFNDEIDYYKVDKKLDLTESNKFDYEENEMLSIVSCFKSYVDRDSNKVLNKLNKKTCKVKDKDGNIVTSNKKIDNIIKLVSKLKHDIILANVVNLDNEYYVIIELNVNWWSPYYLYKYDNNRLRRIYCFDGKNVIALKKLK